MWGATVGLTGLVCDDTFCMFAYSAGADLPPSPPASPPAPPPRPPNAGRSPPEPPGTPPLEPPGAPPPAPPAIPNLARFALTYASSVLDTFCEVGGCYPFYAVDGDTTDETKMLHTAAGDTLPWLSIDLTNVSRITSVRIYHRPGYLGRTRNSELRVGNASVTSTSDSLYGNTLVWKQPAALSENVSVLVFDPPVVGRWVTFQNRHDNATSGEQVLQVLELEVYGNEVAATQRRFPVRVCALPYPLAAAVAWRGVAWHGMACVGL